MASNNAPIRFTRRRRQSSAARSCPASRSRRTRENGAEGSQQPRGANFRWGQFVRGCRFAGRLHVIFSRLCSRGIMDGESSSLQGAGCLCQTCCPSPAVPVTPVHPTGQLRVGHGAIRSLTCTCSFLPPREPRCTAPGGFSRATALHASRMPRLRLSPHALGGLVGRSQRGSADVPLATRLWTIGWLASSYLPPPSGRSGLILLSTPHHSRRGKKRKKERRGTHVFKMSKNKSFLYGHRNAAHRGFGRVGGFDTLLEKRERESTPNQSVRVANIQQL